MAGYYPVALEVKGKKCTVVGGGEVAERKVRELLSCGAAVTVVSPKVTPAMESLAREGRIGHQRSRFTPESLEGAFLVIGATDDEEVNRTVSRECRARKILVNIVDAPEQCDFTTPSVLRRGDLLIGISTGGKSPALARRIRRELEPRFGMEYAEFLEILGDLRERIHAAVPQVERRKEIFERLVDSDILDLLRVKDSAAARRRAQELAREAVESAGG